MVVSAGGSNPRSHGRRFHRLVHHPSSFPLINMASARWSSSRTAKGSVSSDDISKDDDLEEQGSAFITARGPKSRTSENATLKQKVKRSGKRRDAGKLSKLPDMPLDVLYDVSYIIVSIADDEVSDNAFAVCRYSLLFTQWIYCECRGPTKPFVAFSQTSPRDRSGSPLSMASRRLNDPLRVLRT